MCIRDSRSFGVTHQIVDDPAVRRRQPVSYTHLDVYKRQELSIGNNPLYLVMGKANVLVVLDNSNSMDEDASGAAVGSASANSKSEVARGVVRNLTDLYRNRINMGLMAYRQNTPQSYQLHNSPYDASYNPANYDPAWTGARASATNKKYRMPNPTSAGHFVYYNVALPFYSTANYANAFCYSNTADASGDFGGGIIPGAWDNYRCLDVYKRQSP